MKDGEHFSEDALFDQAIEGGETQEAADQGQQQQEEQTEQQTEQVAYTQEPATERQQADDDTAKMPGWRVREINEERKQLAERVKALEAERIQWQARQQQQPPKQEQQAPKAERPDPLLDPEGYAKQVREDIRNELLAERREESLQAALEANPEEFKAAYTAAQQANDPALKARMQASRDPGKTLLAWHREQQTMREVGNDPKAWLEKQLEEKLKDPAFLAKAVERARGSAAPAQQSNGRPRVELPPSLSGASRANAQLRSDNQDLSDDALFDATTA